MHKRIIILFIVLGLTLMAIYNSCGDGDVIVSPKKDDSGPEDPEGPPPPPPPPPDDDDNKVTYLKTTTITLEQIARDALDGRYGAEIQQMLADEVAKCLQLMQSNNIVRVSTDGVNRQIEVINNRSVYFNLECITSNITSGVYGEGPRTFLHLVQRRNKKTEAHERDDSL